MAHVQHVDEPAKVGSSTIPPCKRIIDDSRRFIDGCTIRKGAGLMQHLLFGEDEFRPVAPFRSQLLKWIGNKQRFAHEIASYFPPGFGTYLEPFLGGGGVLGTLAPPKAIASDAFGPLMEIWQALHEDPETLKRWYAERWQVLVNGDKVEEYERIKANYNERPNGADLVFLCRSCYGGVVRFRQATVICLLPAVFIRPFRP